MDFETAWDRATYTLSTKTTEEYVRDKRFKAWGCAYYYLDDLGGKPTWVSHSDLPAFFASVDWSTTAALAHNAQFDVTILAWIYGHVPCFVFDTLSMARALYGVELGNSLKKLAERFNLPPKGDAVHSTNGMLTSIPPEVEKELADYCEHDTALCVALFDIFSKGYPTKELQLIDMTLRMFVEPVLELDTDMLEKAVGEEKQRRENMLEALQIDEKDLASNVKFGNILKGLGIEPPMKVSKVTGKPAYAFAKNDALFQAMLSHERADIATLCEARLAVKSTLERTRGQRFLDIAGRGTLPVPLSYYGAHTGRWAASKGSGLNMQNLKRGSFLRQAIRAPDGYVLGVADLSQIEPRVLAWLAGDESMLNLFRTGADPYATFGATMFNIPGMTKESHPVHRQSAKSGLLGCGYSLGWQSFAAQLLTGFLGADPMLYGISFAIQLGITAEAVERFVGMDENMGKIAAIPHTCSMDELAVHCTIAYEIVRRYRNAAPRVVGLWKLFDSLIGKCLVTDTSISRFGGGTTKVVKCLTFAPGAIILPNEMSLHYPDIKGTPSNIGYMEWTYGPDSKKLYGGKLVENVVQALARIVMTDGMLRIQKRYACKMTIHDEVACLIPEREAEEGLAFMKECMTKEPKYMPGIPLDVSGGYAKRYGDAK
jgi:DNA polymerase